MDDRKHLASKPCMVSSRWWFIHDFFNWFAFAKADTMQLKHNVVFCFVFKGANHQRKEWLLVNTIGFVPRYSILKQLAERLEPLQVLKVPELQHWLLDKSGLISICDKIGPNPGSTSGEQRGSSSPQGNGGGQRDTRGLGKGREVGSMTKLSLESWPHHKPRMKL